MRAVKTNFDFINKKAVKGIFFGALSGIIITVLFTIISSLLIIAIGKISEDAIKYISLVTLALGSLAGGYICARIHKSNGILMGVITGLIMFIVVFTAGLSSFSGNFSIFTVIKAAVMILFAAAGAVIGVNKKEKMRYKSK